MKAGGKEKEKSKYPLSAGGGFALGIFNFLFFFYVLSNCTFNGAAAELPLILFFVIDLPLAVTLQFYFLKEPNMQTYLVMALFFLFGISPITLIKPSCNAVNYCVPTGGFFCYSAAISNTGNLSIKFENTGNAPLYNVGMACAALGITHEIPKPPISMVLLYANGSASQIAANAPATGWLTMTSGIPVSVSALKCWDTNGMPLSSSSFPRGSNFTGTLWLNYTPSPGMPGPQNPVRTIHLIDVGATRTKP